MRKILTFLASATLVWTTNAGFSWADPSNDVYQLTTTSNVPSGYGFVSDASWTWSDGRTIQVFRATRPDGCPGTPNDDCAMWMTDATGEYLLSRRYLESGSRYYSLNLKKPLQETLALGPITVVIGTYHYSASKVYGSAPPEDFVLSTSFQITADSLNASNQCNPFAEQLAGVTDKSKRQRLIEDLIWDADGSRNKPLIDSLRTGKRLNGVTQAIEVKEVKVGFATRISGGTAGDFPETGYYFRMYDKIDYSLYFFDCSRLVTVRTEAYSPYRFGKDGIGMFFNVLNNASVTNEWVTIGGKTYQTVKNAKDTQGSGQMKRCRSISKQFDHAEMLCFVPKKPGSYKVTVKQQYVGSGNLIITCRGNIYSVSCSSARDKSVSRTLTGTFKIDKNGVVAGPNWWFFDY